MYAADTADVFERQGATWAVFEKKMLNDMYCMHVEEAPEQDTLAATKLSATNNKHSSQKYNPGGVNRDNKTSRWPWLSGPRSAVGLSTRTVPCSKRMMCCMYIGKTNDEPPCNCSHASRGAGGI